MIRIKATQCRAARLGLSLRALCQAAQVQYPTVARWFSDEEANPSIRTFADIMGRIEAVLDENELRLLAELIPLHPGAARAEVAALGEAGRWPAEAAE